MRWSGCWLSAPPEGERSTLSTGRVMGRGRTPGSQKRTWKMPKSCSGHFGSPVGAGQEDENAFAATRGLLCWEFFLVGSSDRWAAEDIAFFSLGVPFPQDGCVPLFYVVFGCMVLGYLMYVCMRLASSREGIERTVGALLSSTSPPLDLVHPLGRLCYSLHFSTFHLAPALVMLGSYYLLCMSLSLVPGEAKTRRGAVLAC